MTSRRSVFPARCLGGLVLALVAGWTSAATAQFKDLLELDSPRAVPKPEFSVTLTPATAKVGDEVTLTINVKLPEHYYIYSTSTGKVRTEIETEEKGLKAVDKEFVPDREPNTVFEPVFKGEVSKFYDNVTWKKKYRVSGPKVSIKGSLSGQYCTEGTGNEGEPGQCIPIIPPYEFEAQVTVADAAPVRFEYEERPSTSKTSPVLKFKLSPEKAKPGDKVTMTVTMELAKGWHTFSSREFKENETISSPTEFDVEAINGLKPLGKGFQPDREPEIEHPEPGKTNEVFNDQVTWTREFEVLPGTSPGKYGLAGKLNFQACKNTCNIYKVKFALGETSKSAAAPAAQQTVEAARPQDKGLLPFLLTAFGFGLISLLTPCVFPMVPITVSFFLKQSESEHHRPLMVAFVFCGSIVATFTILGVGISAIFGAAGLNALANHPWLNVVIGLVFVVFAFNMLGLFEIRIPSSLLTFTANKEQAGGYVGAVFMALTFTLTSFTCTFAFAGTLLVAAAQGEFYWPIIGMLAFGAAFALPFFLLALAPSVLKKLPKSGGWMNAVKVVMGLIEIGAAIKFFSVADMVWNPEPVVFDFVFVMIAWLVLSVMIALYLLGAFRLAHDVPPPGISVGRMMLVMVFMGLACSLAVGLFGQGHGGGWFMEQIIAFAPPKFNKDGAPADLPLPAVNHHGIWFSLDVDKAIEHAMKEKRPLFYDFTGVNCTNCRLMEERMVQPRNRALLDKMVLVQLYADKVPTIADRAEVKRLLNRNVSLQTAWFKDVSLPSYAVVSPDGETILSTYFGLEQKEGEFAAFMEKGLQRWDDMQPKAPASEMVDVGAPDTKEVVKN